MGKVTTKKPASSKPVSKKPASKSSNEGVPRSLVVPVTCLVVGSICSGMGTDIMALEAVVGAAYAARHIKHAFFCESDPMAIEFLKKNFRPPLTFFTDVKSDLSEALRAAPACQWVSPEVLTSNAHPVFVAGLKLILNTTLPVRLHLGDVAHSV